MKSTRKLIEKVLLLIFLIGISSAGIKAQKTSPSAMSIRDGVEGNQYSLQDWVDIYSSSDVIGGKTKDGYVYYVTEGGIKLWEPPSSFRKHFWKTLNNVAKCQNWTLDGNEFIPENIMNNFSWTEIINDYCIIDYDSWNKDEVKVFGWSHDKSQKNSKIVPSLRASHPNEGKLCFNTASFTKVNAPQELIPIRSTRCANPLEKRFVCQQKQQKVQIQHQTPTPMVVYMPQQQTQFVYTPSSSGARAITVWEPSAPPQQQTAQVNNTSRFINLGLNIAYTAADVLTQTQPQYYPPQYYPQPQPPQYYPPQPSWGNPNPILGNDNGGPVLGNGGIPQTGGPTFGNGGIPINGNPTYGNSGFSNGNPNYGGGGISTGGSVLGNGGVSTGGPSFGNGGNPSLGNGRPW